MASRRYQLKYNLDKDREIISRLDRQENIQDYIRRLILSDIAADQLLHLQSDIEAGRTKERIKFWEENCPAAGDPDFDCIDCRHYGPAGCTLSDVWEEVKNG